MKKEDRKQIYENRVVPERRTDGSLVTQDLINYDCCSEALSFALKDNYHAFSLGLGTVLECLRAAEVEGYVPKLPVEWWGAIRIRY